MVSHDAAAVSSAVDDGPHELLSETTSKGQCLDDRLAEDAVKEVKTKIKSSRHDMGRGDGLRVKTPSLTAAACDSDNQLVPGGHRREDTGSVGPETASSDEER